MSLIVAQGGLCGFLCLGSAGAGLLCLYKRLFGAGFLAFRQGQGVLRLARSLLCGLGPVRGKGAQLVPPCEHVPQSEEFKQADDRMKRQAGQIETEVRIRENQCRSETQKNGVVNGDGHGGPEQSAEIRHDHDVGEHREEQHVGVEMQRQARQSRVQRDGETDQRLTDDDGGEALRQTGGKPTHRGKKHTACQRQGQSTAEEGHKPDERQSEWRTHTGQDPHSLRRGRVRRTGQRHSDEMSKPGERKGHMIWVLSEICCVSLSLKPSRFPKV